MIKDIRHVIACLTLVTMLYSPISWFVVCVIGLALSTVLYYIVLGLDDVVDKLSRGDANP